MSEDKFLDLEEESDKARVSAKTSTNDVQNGIADKTTGAEGDTKATDTHIDNGADSPPEASDGSEEFSIKSDCPDAIPDTRSCAERIKDGFKASGRRIKEGIIRAYRRFTGVFLAIAAWFAELDKRRKRDGYRRFSEDAFKALWRGTKRLSKRWFIDAFTGMAQGLFVTLIAGTIIKQIGTWIGPETAFGGFVILAGNVACTLMGAGIGAGIASYLKAPKLVIFSCMVAGMIGAFSENFLDGNIAIAIGSGAPGNPIGAYIAALISTELGKLVAGRTKLDILVVPLVTIGATLASVYICIPFIWLVNQIGALIAVATTAQPVVMGIAIAVIAGILLTMPTSSAAICIMLGLDGIAGGAAVVGCACQMVGFAVQSYRENRFSGLISQGIGTSMLQIPNIMRKPIIFLPPIIASAIAGPIATAVFGLQCTAKGSGMGTAGLVGIFATIEASAEAMPAWKLTLAIIILFFVIPAAVCLLMSELMRKYGLIKYGDMKLDYNN